MICPDAFPVTIKGNRATTPAGRCLDCRRRTSRRLDLRRRSRCSVAVCSRDRDAMIVWEWRNRDHVVIEIASSPSHATNQFTGSKVSHLDEAFQSAHE